MATAPPPATRRPGPRFLVSSQPSSAAPAPTTATPAAPAGAPCTVVPYAYKAPRSPTWTAAPAPPSLLRMQATTSRAPPRTARQAAAAGHARGRRRVSICRSPPRAVQTTDPESSTTAREASMTSPTRRTRRRTTRSSPSSSQWWPPSSTTVSPSAQAARASRSERKRPGSTSPPSWARAAAPPAALWKLRPASAERTRLWKASCTAATRHLTLTMPARMRSGEGARKAMTSRSTGWGRPAKPSSRARSCASRSSTTPGVSHCASPVSVLYQKG